MTTATGMLGAPLACALLFSPAVCATSPALDQRVIERIEKIDRFVASEVDRKHHYPFIFTGFSLHEKLRRFVDARLTPVPALQAATTAPARYFGFSE